MALEYEGSAEEMDKRWRLLTRLMKEIGWYIARVSLTTLKRPDMQVSLVEVSTRVVKPTLQCSQMCRGILGYGLEHKVLTNHWYIPFLSSAICKGAVKCKYKETLSLEKLRLTELHGAQKIAQHEKEEPYI